MMVKDLFPGRAFTPFVTDIGGAAGNAGPAPVEGYTLSQLADMIPVQDSSAASAPQARPNPLANITSFVSTIGRVNRLLESQATIGRSRGDTLAQLRRDEPDVYTRYIEWSALSATVALRGVYSMYGLSVTMQSEELDSRRCLFDRALLFALHNMGRSYQFLVSSEDPLTGQPLTGKLFYLLQNGSPFAIYSDEIGVCPILNYRETSFDGMVPWHTPGADEHTSWRDPLDCATGPYVENRFKWWMARNNRKNAVEIPDAASLSAYDVCATIGGWNVVCQELQTLYERSYPDHADRAVRFGTVCGGYIDEQSGTSCMLPLFFTPRLLLACKETADEPCGLGYNSCDGSWHGLSLTGDSATCQQLPGLERLAPVIPFTRQAAELYGKEFEIEALRFDAYAAGTDCLGRVEMHAQLVFKDITAQRFAFTRVYPLDSIVSGLLPYLTVWPWVALPKNSWNTFYATQKDSEADYRSLCGEGFSDTLRLELSEGVSYSVQEKGNPLAAKQAWQVTCHNRRFRYASVCAQDGSSLGVVLIPRVQELDANPAVPANYQLSIDFGTTSTVCAIKDPAGHVSFLPYQEFGRNVTIGNREHDFARVAERRWLGRASENTGDTLLDRKTLSTAQLFDWTPADGSAQPAHAPSKMFVTGRFFLATSTQLCGYTANGSFQNQGIYNDLKLSTDSDTAQKQAGVLYLAGLYMQALLYVLSSTQGVGQIGALRVSYPGGLTRDILEDRWNFAADLVNSCLEPTSPYRLDVNAIQYCTEAEAARRFNQKHIALPGMLGYLNVDIGGGTTDISIVTTPPDPTAPSLSFKYAGREVIINSFIQAYRRWKDDPQQEAARQHFSQIWTDALDPLVPPERAAEVRSQLISNFFRECAQYNDAMLARAGDSESLRMMLEILLNDFDMVVPRLGQYNLLRSLFTAKFFLLMRMVAEFMAQNADRLEALIDTRYNSEGEPVPNICISFTGTAAMTLQHVFALPADQLNQLSSLRQDLAAGRLLDKVAAMVGRVMGKPSLALTLMISPSVREKKEVAFGILTSDGFRDDAGEMPTVSEQEVADLFFQLDDAQRRDWYRRKFGANLAAGEADQQAQVTRQLDGTTSETLDKYRTSLSRRVNERKIRGWIAEIRRAPEAMQAEVEQTIKSWSTFTEAVGHTQTTWPVAAPFDTNLGLGYGKTTLNSVLPRGNELTNAIINALNDLDNPETSASLLRYLVSIPEDTYRRSLLRIYVVEKIINQALYQNQVQN